MFLPGFKQLRSKRSSGTPKRLRRGATKFGAHSLGTIFCLQTPQMRRQAALRGTSQAGRSRAAAKKEVDDPTKHSHLLLAERGWRTATMALRRYLYVAASQAKPPSIRDA